MVQTDAAPPQDVPTIKEHLRVRREAMAAIAEETQILLYLLSQKLSNIEFIRYLTEVAAEDPALRKAYEEELAKAKEEEEASGGHPKT